MEEVCKLILLKESENFNKLLKVTEAKLTYLKTQLKEAEQELRGVLGAMPKKPIQTLYQMGEKLGVSLKDNTNVFNDIDWYIALASGQQNRSVEIIGDKIYELLRDKEFNSLIKLCIREMKLTRNTYKLTQEIKEVEYKLKVGRSITTEIMYNSWLEACKVELPFQKSYNLFEFLPIGCRVNSSEQGVKFPHNLKRVGGGQYDIELMDIFRIAISVKLNSNGNTKTQRNFMEGYFK